MGSTRRIAILFGLSGIALSGCLPQESVGLPAASPAETHANIPPVISGVPGTSAVAGNPYSFQPAASDPDGDALGFAISNKPAWANFSTSTGALTGTAQAGTYSDITITVSDGHDSESLVFSLVVTPPPAVVGSAVLHWSPPVQYVDGSALSLGDLAGYRLYHGTSANVLNDVVDLSDAGELTYTFRQLGPGVHYFAVSAITVLGAESALTPVKTKTIL